MDQVKSKIAESFDELGVEYDKIVLEKCFELCLEHGVEDADDFVDSWMAFTVSHLQGSNPSPTNLARFEREVLAKRSKRRGDIDFSDGTDKLNSLLTPQRNSQTPESRGVGCRLVTSPRGAFSPASFSPVVGTPSTKYTNRQNAGSIISEKINTIQGKVWDGNVTVGCISSELNENFMSFHLGDCADAVDALITRLVEQLSRRYSLDEILPLATKNSTNIVVAGRVVCDADGKLNAESLLLEDSGGELVKLDLSSIGSFSVFPGQIVAVEGLNVSGSKMIGRAIYCDASMDMSPPKLQLPGALSIFVASGPFTPSDSLTYQPLTDFLDIVVREEPHVLLLTGPIVDADHPAISGGLVAETFQDMFDRILEQIMLPLARTEVVLVSSYRESHGAAVFPTYSYSNTSRPKLTMVHDPCTIDVNGFIIGATSVDVLMHLGREEVTFPIHSGDRLSRLAGHILQQQSFYPLRPPPLGLPLDPSMEKNLLLPVVPHLLILPSDLKCFIKDVKGCTVVNPEHLAKGLVGGHFAKLAVECDGTVFGQIIKV